MVQRGEAGFLKDEHAEYKGGQLTARPRENTRWGRRGVPLDVGGSDGGEFGAEDVRQVVVAGDVLRHYGYYLRKRDPTGLMIGGPLTLNAS